MPKKRFSVLSFSVYSFHYNFYFSYETLILLRDLKVYNMRDIIIFLFKLNQFCYTVFWAFILPNLSGIFIKQSLTSLHSFKFVWSALVLIWLGWFGFETGFYGVWTDLKITMCPSMTLNFSSSSFKLSGAGVKGMSRQPQLRVL